MYNYKQTFNPHTIKEKTLSQIITKNEKTVWYEEKNTKTDNHKIIKEDDNER